MIYSCYAVLLYVFIVVTGHSVADVCSDTKDNIVLFLHIEKKIITFVYIAVFLSSNH